MKHYVSMYISSTMLAKYHTQDLAMNVQCEVHINYHAIMLMYVHILTCGRPGITLRPTDTML